MVNRNGNDNNYETNYTENLQFNKNTCIIYKMQSSISQNTQCTELKSQSENKSQTQIKQHECIQMFLFIFSFQIFSSLILVWIDFRIWILTIICPSIELVLIFDWMSFIPLKSKYSNTDSEWTWNTVCHTQQLPVFIDWLCAYVSMCVNAQINFVLVHASLTTSNLT